MVSRVLKRAELEFALWVGHWSNWSLLLLSADNLGSTSSSSINIQFGVAGSVSGSTLINMLRWKWCASLVFCSWTISFCHHVLVGKVSTLCANLIPVPSQTKIFFCCDMLSRGSFDATVMCLPPTSLINSELSLHDMQRNSCKVQQRPEAKGSCNGDRDWIRCRVRQGGWKRGVRLPRLPVGI